MIRVNVNESFPVTATLLDEDTGLAATGQVVYYDVRKQPNDSSLDPPVSGTLTESSIESGIYKEVLSIEEAGTYLVYVTCSGFLTNTEEIIVNKENIYEVIKQSRHYNISVEDVIRTEDHPTTSQVSRNVPKGKTDYVITRIKRDEDSDWSGPYVVEGRVYAWYTTDKDKAPYKMGESE
jgi:hypothetical protein